MNDEAAPSGTDGTTPAVPRRIVPRGAARAGQLLDVATALLRERGYEGFTVEEFAARAGASKATVYRRWRSKDEIVADVVARAVRPAAPVDTGSVRDDLIELFVQVAEELADISRTLRGMILTPQQTPGLAGTFDRRFQQPAARAFAQIIERARARGELRPGVDPDFIRELTLPLLVVKSARREPVDRAYLTRLVDTVYCPLVLNRDG